MFYWLVSTRQSNIFGFFLLLQLYMYIYAYMQKDCSGGN